MISGTVGNSFFSAAMLYFGLWLAPKRSTLLMIFCTPAKTTVPNQNLFISASFWWLLAQLKVVLIFGGNGVLRRCWWLVLQCRYKGCSLVPIFDDYWHCWKFFYFLGAMLYFGTVEYNSAEKMLFKNAIFEFQALFNLSFCFSEQYCA